MKQNQQNSEQNIFEEDAKKLAERIGERKKSPEFKNYSDKDLIRQSLRPESYLKNGVKLQEKPASQPVIPKKEEEFLPDYLKDSSKEIKEKVEFLLEYTLKNGIVKGISNAQKFEPFILDAYRDALVDKLHNELVNRKLL